MAYLEENANENVTCSNFWTHTILMHLTYLLTCCFNFRLLLILSVNSRQFFYLNKRCELKQCFLHVWHGIDQTIIDNAIDVWRGRLRMCTDKRWHFEQLQYSAIWQKMFQFLSNMTPALDCIFLEIITNSNFELSHGSVATHWRYGGKYYMGFVGNSFLFPAMKEFWKSIKNWQSHRPEFDVLLFWDTVYIE